MDHIYDIIKDRWTHINVGARAAFVAAFVVGIITHLYALTNKLPNWDELSIGFQGGGYYLGRWFSDQYYSLFSHITSPGVNGVMTILFLALAAGMTARILRIHSVTGGILAGAMIVTFPSVASQMTYMFVSPIYALCLFLITLAVWMIRTFRYGWGPAALLIMFSMAGYQAYFPYATALCLLALIADVMEGAEESMVVRKGFRELAGLAIGMLFYIWSLSALNVQMPDYRGLQNIGGNSLGEYVRGILRAYHRLFQYFVTNPPSYAQGSANRFNELVMVILVLLVLLLLKRDEVHSRPFRTFMYVVFTALTPLAIGLIYVMSVEVQSASPLMVYSYVLIYIWVIMLCEHLNSERHWKRVLMDVAFVVLILVAYSNFRVTSDAYYRMYIANERVEGFYNRVIARVEAQEGYSYDDELYLLGSYNKEEEFFLDTYQLQDEVYTDLEGITIETNLLMEQTRIWYLRLFLGIENERHWELDEIIDELKSTPEYQALDCWPAENCIAEINDIWVVKMAED